MGNVQVRYDSNPLYVHLKKHFCMECGTRLRPIQIRDPSRTGKPSFRDHIVGGVYWFGDVEYKVCVFYCPNCKSEIPTSRQKFLEAMNR